MDVWFNDNAANQLTARVFRNIGFIGAAGGFETQT
jgi:hypothetical protein